MRLVEPGKAMKLISKTLIPVFIIIILSNLNLLEPSQVVAQDRPLVLAFYYAWFDQNTWASGQTVDLPSEPYISADRAVIERHVAQAQGAGIDAFIQAWYGPQEANNQTETNFRTLLEVAAAAGFRAAVDVEVSGPFFGDAGAVTNALSTLLATHAQHPAYLRYQGKPVIFFWRQQRFSVEQWTTIRNQVDPNRDSYWVAEGTDLAYQSVFDGHHLYSIAWAASPADQLAKWGERVRTYEAENQVERLWVATAMPGYNDTALPRENAFVAPRRNGDYYRETWRGALTSQPEMIVITSFNEWPEGTHIEPSAGYGNLYLDITRELVAGLGGNPPARAQVAPAALRSAQADPTEEPAGEATPPAGPIIRVEGLVNVRSGPSTTFERVGQLEAGSVISVTGQVETGDWWQIEYEAGPEGKAWVADEVVDFVGNRAEVPVVVAPEAPPAASDENAAPAATPTKVLPTVEIPLGGINVRSGPGLDFDSLGRLDQGEAALIVGKDETGTWWQIEYEAGEEGLGWITASLVDFSGEAADVPVIIVTGEDDIFPTPTPTPTPLVVAGRIESTDAINVRAEPSLDGTIVGGLYLGDSADVYAVSEDGEWWQIDFPDGPQGLAWVAAEFVRFQGDQESVPIFGLGTPTPTPGPTDTPTPTRPQPSPTAIEFPPTFAPTATSIYQGTAAAALEKRGTPDLGLAEPLEAQPVSFRWSDLPWGVLSIVVVAGFLWYQWRRRRNGW